MKMSFFSDQSLITLNLSGAKFQITQLAFSLLRPSVLKEAVVIFNNKLNKNEYFFTRNINCFIAILDYLENGVLHIPASVCPLSFQGELDFWGLKFSIMQNCCRRRYQDWENQETFLDKFDFERHGQKEVPPTTRCWEKTRQRGWDVLNNPSSSWWAKVCLAIKVVAVFIFISECAASTHDLFQTKIAYENIPKFMDAHRETFTDLCLNPDQDKFDSIFIKQLCSLFHGSQQNISSINKRGTIGILKDYKHIDSNVSFVNGKENSDVNIGSIRNQTKESINYKDNNPHTFEDVNIAQSNILEDPEKKIFDIESTDLLVRQINVANALRDKDNGVHSRTGLKLLGLTPGYATLRTNQSSKLAHPNADHYFASRVRRNIEVLHQHPLDDHMADIEDIVIYKTVYWLCMVEMVMALYFVAEYILEFIFAPNKLQYVMSFYSFVDVVTTMSLVVLHIYVALLHPYLNFANGGWEYFKAVKSLKILKLFKFVKGTRGFRVLVFTIKHSYKDFLALVVYVWFILTVVAFSMYYLEKDNMRSIPNAMWWTVVTVTTLGYGDVVPTSIVGKWLGSVCAVGGVIVFALMVPIFVNDFLILNKFSKIKRSKIETRPMSFLLTSLNKKSFKKKPAVDRLNVEWEIEHERSSLERRRSTAV